MLTKIAVTQPNFRVYSETFIRNHIRYLGERMEVHDLAGGWVPAYANGKALVPRWVIFAEKVAAKLRGKAFIHAWIAHRVRKYLRDNAIQMVLCEYGPGGVAMMPICTALNIPFAVHFFGLDLHGKKLIEQYGVAYREMFQKAQLIVAISTLQKRVLLDMGCPPEKIRHITCGADLGYLPEVFAEKKPPVFLAVGRLVEKKAPLVTLAAFREVVRSYPEARLDIVGDGPLLQACRDFVEREGLSQQVSFLLSRPPEFIAKLLQESCCFVQHSVTASDGDSEGTPVAILDAGLAGVPVVSTRHAGIADVVVDGKTGYLVPEYDMEAMAARMKDILRDPEAARQMGRSASDHVLKNYAVSVTIRQLHEALNEAYASFQTSKNIRS